MTKHENKVYIFLRTCILNSCYCNIDRTWIFDLIFYFDSWFYAMQILFYICNDLLWVNISGICFISRLYCSFIRCAYIMLDVWCFVCLCQMHININKNISVTYHRWMIITSWNGGTRNVLRLINCHMCLTACLWMFQSCRKLR